MHKTRNIKEEERIEKNLHPKKEKHKDRIEDKNVRMKEKKEEKNVVED